MTPQLAMEALQDIREGVRRLYGGFLTGTDDDNT